MPEVRAFGDEITNVAAKVKTKTQAIKVPHDTTDSRAAAAAVAIQAIQRGNRGRKKVTAIKELFDTIDTNHDGSVTRRELLHMLGSSGGQGSDLRERLGVSDPKSKSGSGGGLSAVRAFKKSFDHAFVTMDTNKDGSVSVSEFSEFLSKYRFDKSHQYHGKPPLPHVTGVLTSTEIKSTEHWYERSLLIPHEAIRIDMNLLESYLADKRIEEEDYRLVRFFRLWKRFEFCVHHHHDAEETIYLPWIRKQMPGGIIPGDNTKDDHIKLLQEMEAITKMRIQCGVPEAKKECKRIEKQQILKLTMSATFDKLVAINELRQRFVLLKKSMFEHLAEEERTLPPILRDNCTEKGESEVVESIIKSLGVSGNAKMLPWLTSAMYTWDPVFRTQFMKSLPSIVRMGHDKFWEKKHTRKHGSILREFANGGKLEKVFNDPLEVVIENIHAGGNSNSHTSADGKTVAHEIGLGINLDPANGMQCTELAAGQCMKQGVEVGMRLVGVNGTSLEKVMTDVKDLGEFKRIVKNNKGFLILNFNKLQTKTLLKQASAVAERASKIGLSPLLREKKDAAAGKAAVAKPTEDAKESVTDIVKEGAKAGTKEGESGIATGDSSNAGETSKSLVVKSLTGTPDRTFDMHTDLKGGVFLLGTAKVVQFTMKAGGSWEKCVKPSMAKGTARCLARRVGMVESGAMRVKTALGFEKVIKTGECYVVEPGHLMWVEGEEDLKTIEFESKLGGDDDTDGVVLHASGMATAKEYSRLQNATTEGEKLAKEPVVGVISRSFKTPDKTMNMGDDGSGGGMFCACVASLGTAKCMEITAQPGASWAKHVRPELAKLGKGDLQSCPARHVGFVKRGAFRITMDDGETQDLKCGDCYVIGPGHNADVIGDEEGVMVEFETKL